MSNANHKHFAFDKRTEKFGKGHVISKTEERCLCGAKRLVTKTTMRTISTEWTK